MENLKTLAFFCIIVVSACVAVYVGVYVLFIGGIINIVNSNGDNTLITYGIIKILCSVFAGTLIFLFPVMIAKIFLHEDF